MSSKSKITKAHYETLAEFRYALRKFMRFSEDAAQSAGVTPQQHQAMLAIKGFPGRDRITIGELSERLQIKHHSVVGLADRLVVEKYVQRLTDQKDHRQVHLMLENEANQASLHLMLTTRGEAVLEKLSATHQEQLRRVGPQINQLLESLRGENPAASQDRHA